MRFTIFTNGKEKSLTIMIRQFNRYIKRLVKLEFSNRPFFPIVDFIITISGLNSTIDFNINFANSKPSFSMSSGT
jgi:hypothetical protein